MDKKTEILNSAYKHFSKRGYNVSMSDIAKDVGIKTPSLYSHFTSKDEIILIVIEKEIERYCAFLEALYEKIGGKNWLDQIETLFFSVVDYFKVNDHIRFYRNILLIDQDDLRKKCSDKVYRMELFHLEKLEKVFPRDAEGNSLLFLSVIQGALEVELLFYESEQTAETYITKIWRTYRENLGD